MSNLLDKFKNLVLGAEFDDMEDDVSEDMEDVRASREREHDITDINAVRSRRSTAASSSKIVNFQNSLQLQVVITYPKSLQDASYICDFVKDNKACVVNLEGVEKAQSQRIADFLSGSTYALSGEIQRVSNEIFIMAPVNVSISGELKDELKKEGLFSWIPSSTVSLR